MKIILIGLTVAPISVASFAMNNGHNKNQAYQQTQFKRVQLNGITLSNFRARASIGRTNNSGIYGEIQAVKTDRLLAYQLLSLRW